MRDVVTGFYKDVFARLIVAGNLSISDSVLIVCAGPLDEGVLREVGFTVFTITNLDGGMANQRQDAEI